MEEIPRETFEFCSICNSCYTLKGRRQHLKSKKHCLQMLKNDIQSNDDIPVEHYSLVLNGIIDIDIN